MPIPVVCSACATKLKAPDNAAGRKTKCPKCATPIAIPGGAPVLSPQIAEPRRQAVAAVPPPLPSPPKSQRASVAPPPPPLPPSLDDVESVPDAEAITDVPASKPKKKVESGKFDDLEIVIPGPNRPGVGGGHWETSELGQRERLLVTRATGLGLRYMVYNDFFIRDPKSKDIIGVASDAPSTLVQFASLFNIGSIKLRKYLPTTLEIREDEKGPLLFTLRRVPQLFRFCVVVEIFDSMGHKLGHFQSKMFSFMGGFWVYDANEAKVAELKFQMGLPPKYVFVTTDGVSMGSIYQEGTARSDRGEENDVHGDGWPGPGVRPQS